MAKITITEDNLLTSEEFNKRLDETEENASLMHDLLDLMRQLIAFEQQYNMPSDLFYDRFMRGEMGDAMPIMKWAGRYELYLELKWEIEYQISTIIKKVETEDAPLPELRRHGDFTSKLANDALAYVQS